MSRINSLTSISTNSFINRLLALLQLLGNWSGSTSLQYGLNALFIYGNNDDTWYSGSSGTGTPYLTLDINDSTQGTNSYTFSFGSPQYSATIGYTVSTGWSYSTSYRSIFSPSVSNYYKLETYWDAAADCLGLRYIWTYNNTTFFDILIPNDGSDFTVKTYNGTMSYQYAVPTQAYAYLTDMWGYGANYPDGYYYTYYTNLNSSAFNTQAAMVSGTSLSFKGTSYLTLS